MAQTDTSPPTTEIRSGSPTDRFYTAVEIQDIRNETRTECAVRKTDLARLNKVLRIGKAKLAQEGIAGFAMQDQDLAGADPLRFTLAPQVPFTTRMNGLDRRGIAEFALIGDKGCWVAARLPNADGVPGELRMVQVNAITHVEIAL